LVVQVNQNVICTKQLVANVFGTIGVDMKRAQYFKTMVAALVLFSGPASAIEYFPSETGPVFSYSSGPVKIQVTGSGIFKRVKCEGCIVWEETEFIVDSGGDVLLQSHIISSNAAPDPGGFLLTPNLKYLDFPLETSKSWVSTAHQDNFFDAPSDTVTLTATVLGPATVSVPAGDFEVIIVSLEFEYRIYAWNNRSEVLWLHRQLGPVNNLESWTGIVEAEEKSLGSIKALYR